MIGAMSARRRIQIVNAPVTPVFTAPGTMTSTNGPAGSGSFSFQFNATKRSCTTNTTGSVSGSGASSFTYFAANALIDPLDYEVRVNLGTNVGNSNIAASGGSATLNVWHNLASSPLFTFSCSARRGGSRPITVDIRHKVDAVVTASTTITLNQSSDAVVPTFAGVGGTTSMIKQSGTNSVLGLYIDSDSAANGGKIRTYRDTTLFTTTGFTFSTGSIPESEYEFLVTGFGVTPSNAMNFISAGGPDVWVDIAARRPQSPSSASGARFTASFAAPAGVGSMSLRIRHKLDQDKIGITTVNFQTF